MKMWKNEDGEYDWHWFAVSIVVLILAWSASWYFIDHCIKSSSPTFTDEAARGVFGDKFGAVNSLFSSIAFVGIIFAIILQRRDLLRQRNAINTQAELTKIQMFESGFFNLLSMFKGNAESITTPAGHKGKEAYKYFSDLIRLSSNYFDAFDVLKKLSLDEVITIKDTGVFTPDILTKIEDAGKALLTDCLTNRKDVFGKYLEKSVDLHWEYINQAYNTAHKKSGEAFSHYFRSLYVTYKYVDEYPGLTPDQRKNYGRIIRAQLSDYELLVIFYNALAKPDNKEYFLEFGYDKMTKYVINYEIAQNLNPNRTFHMIHWDILKSVATSQGA